MRLQQVSYRARPTKPVEVPHARVHACAHPGARTHARVHARTHGARMRVHVPHTCTTQLSTDAVSRLRAHMSEMERMHGSRGGPSGRHEALLLSEAYQAMLQNLELEIKVSSRSTRARAHAHTRTHTYTDAHMHRRTVRWAVAMGVAGRSTTSTGCCSESNLNSTFWTRFDTSALDSIRLGAIAASQHK